MINKTKNNLMCKGILVINEINSLFRLWGNKPTISSNNLDVIDLVELFS